MLELEDREKERIERWRFHTGRFSGICYGVMCERACYLHPVRRVMHYLFNGVRPGPKSGIDAHHENTMVTLSAAR
jgi:hypothetical protein